MILSDFRFSDRIDFLSNYETLKNDIDFGIG